MSDHFRSEDPANAAAAVRAHVEGEPPPVGARHECLVDAAFRAAEAGHTNDEILALLDDLCDRWGKYPGRYERWSKLLGMLRLARDPYPNGSNGQGWLKGSADG